MKVIINAFCYTILEAVIKTELEHEIILKTQQTEVIQCVNVSSILWRIFSGVYLSRHYVFPVVNLAICGGL